MPIIEGGGLNTPLRNAGVPVSGTDEVQLLTYTAIGAGSNVATAGTFKLTFDGYTTTALAFGASANAVRDALRLLPSIGTLGCSVTVAAGPPRVYTVTFDGGNMAKLAVPLMTLTDDLLTDASGPPVLPVNVVITESVVGVTATGRGAPLGALLIDTTNGGQYQNTGTALLPVWALQSGVTTSSSTAELNFNDGPTAGVATASKTAVLGANKNLDEFHTAALYLGADAGTLITATAAELNKIAASGMAIDGLGKVGVAHFSFNPTADAAMKTQAAHGVGVTLPQHAIVIGGFFDVNTAFTSTNSTATVAIMVEGAADIVAAAPVSGAPWSTVGRKAVIPKFATPESTSVKATAAREITVTVGVEALLGGKLTGFLAYVVSAASA